MVDTVSFFCYIPQMLQQPWIVMGCGRSGSSTVARILNNHFRINMGDKLRGPDPFAPLGYYEDADMHAMNKSFLWGQTSYPDWCYWTQIYIKKRQARDIPWGFKVGGVPYFLGLYLSLLPKPKIIRVIRKFSLVHHSQVTKWKHDPDMCKRTIMGKMKALRRVLQYVPHQQIYFNERRRSDKEIAKEISEFWKININDPSTLRNM